MKTKRLSIRLTPDEQVLIKQLADSRNLSISDLIKQLVFHSALEQKAH